MLTPNDIWYGNITRPYHTRMAAAGSFLSFTLDRISSIAMGAEVGGNNLIETLASRGQRILEYQYSRGLVQDFPVDDRRAKEVIIREKPKKVGHKGGRGGINAPKRRKIDIQDEGVDHIDEETVQLEEFADMNQHSPLVQNEVVNEPLNQPQSSEHAAIIRTCCP